MAIYKIFPEKDTTLYTEFPNKNTGLDQIIESSTYQSNATAQVSRYLIKFPTSQITEMYTDRIKNGEIDPEKICHLNVYDIFPENWKELLDLVIKRDKLKYDLKPEAMTDVFMGERSYPTDIKKRIAAKLKKKVRKY